MFVTGWREWKCDSRWWSGRAFLAEQVISELSPEWFNGTKHAKLREEHARWRKIKLPKAKVSSVSARIRKTDVARTQSGPKRRWKMQGPDREQLCRPWIQRRMGNHWKVLKRRECELLDIFKRLLQWLYRQRVDYWRAGYHCRQDLWFTWGWAP